MGINRKIKRGTLGHRDDPLVIEYQNKYKIGKGLVFAALRAFGDSKYTHKFCEFLVEWQKNNKTSGINFEYLVEEFEGTGHGVIIENKLNAE